jgi:hypothetical protein
MVDHWAFVNVKKAFLYSEAVRPYPSDMSDVQNEIASSSGTEYPPVLDEVTDEQLAEVQGDFKKERALTEGPATIKHNAWKRDMVKTVLDGVSGADAFVRLGTVVRSTRMEFDNSPGIDFQTAVLNGLAKALASEPPANESAPVAAAA